MSSDPNVGPVTLYAYFMSPYAAKVHCFLLNKRVPFVRRLLELADDGRAMRTIAWDGERSSAWDLPR